MRPVLVTPSYVPPARRSLPASNCGASGQKEAGADERSQNSSRFAASISGRIAAGPRAGKRVTRVGDAVDADDAALSSSRCCAAFAGCSVHAGVCVPARDRIRLERLVRYAGRPPLATARLSLLADGRLLYQRKRRCRDGTTHVIYEPLELIERLAALVPSPKFNVTRYSGVLAPAVTFRPMIIPQSEAPVPLIHACCQAGVETRQTESGVAKEQCGCRQRNYSWAQWMTRVFEFMAANPS
jgi:hypothetical protein